MLTEHAVQGLGLAGALYTPVLLMNACNAHIMHADVGLPLAVKNHCAAVAGHLSAVRIDGQQRYGADGQQRYGTDGQRRFGTDGQLQMLQRPFACTSSHCFGCFGLEVVSVVGTNKGMVHDTYTGDA